MNKEQLVNLLSPAVSQISEFANQLTSKKESQLSLIEKAYINFLIEEKEFIADIGFDEAKKIYRREAVHIILRNVLEESIRLENISGEKFYSTEIYSRACIFLKDHLSLNYEDISFITSLDEKVIIEFYFNGKRALFEVPETRMELNTNATNLLMIKKITNDLITDKKDSVWNKITKVLDTTVLEF